MTKEKMRAKLEKILELADPDTLEWLEELCEIILFRLEKR